MTTLYRPVLIESVEQAEALPAGTLARHSDGAGMDHAHKVSPIGRDVWVAVGGNCTNAEMVGWTALERIEVKEIPETFRDRRGPGRNDHRTVYCTPWEEA